MKNIILSAFALAFVFAACNSNSDEQKQAEPVKTTGVDTLPKTETTDSESEQLYACSMHPEVIGKKGEKCSKCGMNLTVPVKKSRMPN